MKRLEVSAAVRHIYKSLGFKRLRLILPGLYNNLNISPHLGSIQQRASKNLKICLFFLIGQYDRTQ